MSGVDPREDVSRRCRRMKRRGPRARTSGDQELELLQIAARTPAGLSARLDTAYAALIDGLGDPPHRLPRLLWRTEIADDAVTFDAHEG
jgi:hypothetical protein